MWYSLSLVRLEVCVFQYGQTFENRAERPVQDTVFRRLEEATGAVNQKSDDVGGAVAVVIPGGAASAPCTWQARHSAAGAERVIAQQRATHSRVRSGIAEL